MRKGKMKHRSQWLLTSTLALGLLVLPALAAATTYYVDASRVNDTGDGLTLATAWKTITHAADTVPAGTAGVPNVIMVADGIYDFLGNGEDFPINFTNDFVGLTAVVGGTPTLDTTQADPSLRDALDVDGKGFSVSGLTFENAMYAIDISEGGFSITNNTFGDSVTGGVEDGIHFERYEADLSASVSFADMGITGNTFYTTSNGIYVWVQQDFDYITENLTATFGNFMVTGNTFEVHGGDGIYVSDLFYVEDLYNGTVTVGNFTLSTNTFTGGSYGLDFFSQLDDLEDTQATVGNTLINNNTFTDQSSYAIDMDYWDITYIYGTSSVVTGDLTVSDNTITGDVATYTDCDGIYMDDLGYIQYIYDESTVTTGAVNVTNNKVDISDYALYIYFDPITYIGEQYWGDTVVVTMGPTNITGNTFTSDDYYGAYIEYYDMAYYTYGQSKIVIGAVNVSNNTITSYYDALYFYIDYLGDYMYEDSSLLFNPITLNDNKLTSTDDDAMYVELYEPAYEMYDSSSVNIQSVDISGNILKGYGYGLYFYYDYFGNYMYDNSSLTMGPATISNNTVTSTNSYGMYIEWYEFAYDVYNNATATMGPFTINGNTITSSDEGLYFDWDYIGEDMEDNSSLTIDTVTISDNKVTSSNDAAFYWYMDSFAEDLNQNSRAALAAVNITGNTLTGYNEALYFYFDQAAYSLYDTSEVTMGTFTVSGNTMKSTGGGDPCFFLEYNGEYIGSYLHDYAQATLPNWVITNNSLDTVGNYDGFYFDNEYNPYYNEGYSTVRYGSMLIDSNTFNPNKDAGMEWGIYLYFYESGYGTDEASTWSYGDITISNNKLFNIGDEAIYVGFDDIAYDLSDAPKVSMGDLDISQNTIDMAEYGVSTYFYLDADDGTTLTVGDLNIVANDLTNISDYGIYVDYSWVGADSDASVSVGNTTIDANEVHGLSGSMEGIYLHTDVEDEDNVAFGEVNVLGNSVSGFENGIYLDYVKEAMVGCNIVQLNSISGLYFGADGLFSGSHTAINNTLVDNGLGVQVDPDASPLLVVNAEKNWWGDAAGPVACASCNKISAAASTLSFDPWLHSAPTSQCGSAFSWPMFIPAITGAGIR
jgi:hypothetical protein